MYQLLIADDEPITRKGIQSLLDLSKIGIHQVLEAQDGKEVLQVVEESHPDIILLDINMPGIDGLTVAEIVKQKYPQTYIIMLTGYDYFEYTQKAIRAKVDDYILKPVTKEDIHHILKNACDSLLKQEKEQIISQLSPSSSDVTLTEQHQMIKEYIDTFLYNKELSLQHMAMKTGYTSNYLSILVKQLYAMPFQEYINQKRMERAKILLLSSDLKNNEISEAIGIEDVNYFITKFKKYVGVTPKQYQKGKQL